MDRLPQVLPFTQIPNMPPPPTLRLRLTVIAMGTFAGVMYLTCLSNVLTDRVNTNVNLPRSQRQPPCPDVFLQLLVPLAASVDWFNTLPDLIVAISVALSFIRMVLTKHPDRTIRRIIYVLACSYLLRSVTTIVTAFPNPLLSCESRAASENPFIDAAFCLAGQRATCGDGMCLCLDLHCVLLFSSTL